MYFFLYGEMADIFPVWVVTLGVIGCFASRRDFIGHDSVLINEQSVFVGRKYQHILV